MIDSLRYDRHTLQKDQIDQSQIKLLELIHT